jgi:hypothetical protein
MDKKTRPRHTKMPKLPKHKNRGNTKMVTEGTLRTRISKLKKQVKAILNDQKLKSSMCNCIGDHCLDCEYIKFRKRHEK